MKAIYVSQTSGCGYEDTGVIAVFTSNQEETMKRLFEELNAKHADELTSFFISEHYPLPVNPQTVEEILNSAATWDLFGYNR